MDTTLGTHQAHNPLGPWLRDRTGMSYRQIATAAGMNQPTLNRQLDGTHPLLFETLQALAGAGLGLDLAVMCRVSGLLTDEQLASFGAVAALAVASDDAVVGGGAAASWCCGVFGCWGVVSYFLRRYVLRISATGCYTGINQTSYNRVTDGTLRP